MFDFLSFFNKTCLQKNPMIMMNVGMVQYVLNVGFDSYLMGLDLCLKKGTILYKIRKYDKSIDIDDSISFLASPMCMTQGGRLHKPGQKTLYLSGCESTCLREMGLQEGDEYILAKFRVKQDIQLGSFCSNIGDENNIKLKYLMDASLSVPVKDGIFDDIADIYNMSGFFDAISPMDHDLPFKFMYCMNKSSINEYYMYTNFIADVFRQNNFFGIMYQSCYSAHNVKYCCNDDILYFNFALFDDSLVDFLGADVRICQGVYSRLDFVKFTIDAQNNLIQKLIDDTCEQDVVSLPYHELKGLIG